MLQINVIRSEAIYIVKITKTLPLPKRSYSATLFLFFKVWLKTFLVKRQEKASFVIILAMSKMAERPKDLRPREKLQARGAASLSDYELIMAIIGSGNATADVTQIAREVLKVLKQRGSDLKYSDLIKIKVLGPAKATQLMAGYELWRRRFEIPDRPIVNSASDAVSLLADIRTKKQEHFVSLSLDGANRLIQKRIVSVGTINASLAHPREIFADVITDRAAGIIVAHNHPSGTALPSPEDIQTTKRLKEVADLLGINFYDHLIVTSDDYLSILSSAEWYLANN